MSLNWDSIRAQFPLLTENPKISFLDSAASAQKPSVVLDAMTNFQKQHYANIHRGLYKLSAQATQAYEDAREVTAKFLNAPTNSIVFTRNATESFNLIAQTWGRTNLNASDAILLTQLEHHANIVPWQLLAEEKDLQIIVAKPNKDGIITLQAVKDVWQNNIKLASFSHLSNALGTAPQTAEIIKFLKQNNTTIAIDGSQSAVHGPVDITALDCDFFACTGHKLYGPTGIGVLYGKESILNQMPPYQGGGDMIETVSFSGTTFALAPARFEAGTPNFVAAVGLAEALNFITSIPWDEIQHRENELGTYMRDELKNLDATIYGNPKGGITSFNLPNCHPSDIATILDQCNVAVRSGHHCCMPLMEHLGVSGTVRASIGLYNNAQDVDNLIAGLKKAKTLLA